jgi:outer membrane protein assembly factor BamB
VVRAPLQFTAVVVAALAACAGCVTVSGSVYVDRNGDHVREADEPGLGGVVVMLDRGASAVTRADGTFQLDAASSGEQVWARVPDGYRPGPVWQQVARDGAAIELGVVPVAHPEDAAAAVTFVVAADSHTPIAGSDAWDGGDLADAIDQATSLPEPPRFFTIVGDVSNGALLGQYQRVEQALSTVDVPWVPVAGNHDWFDGGVEYGRQFGPANYSFDVGSTHVVVWDTNMSADDQVAFVGADLARVPLAMTVVALGHASPDDDVADRFAALGVDYMFTGHWHANRRVARRGLVEWGTQTFVMGGIDQSPAAYRVVTIDSAGAATVDTRERLVQPHLALSSPSAASCVDPRGATILVAAALDASEPTVTARVDCGPEVALVAGGGWAFRGDLGELAPGAHQLELRARSPAASGRELVDDETIEVCDAPVTRPAAGASWPQLGGDATHSAGAPVAAAPPLVQAWATSIGGAVALGTPLIVSAHDQPAAGDLAIVVQTDRARGDTGGVVALDLATGAIRWRATTPFPATGAALYLPADAPADGLVIAALGDGELRAYAVADGEPRWTASVATALSTLASSQWAAPTVADGVVYAGVPGRVAAFDAATGAPRWQRDLSPDNPWLGSLASPAIGGGVAITAESRVSGVSAWDVATGAPVWSATASYAQAVNATPVIAGGTLVLADVSGDVSALDAATGQLAWSRALTPGGFDWGYSITAAPVVVGTRVIVPTQWDDLVALDLATGNELWRAQAPAGPLEFAHYRSAQAGFAASPLASGDVVWIGRPDGTLAALDVADGHERWSIALGAPIVSAPAPIDGGLVVAGYDGVVRALVPVGATGEPRPAIAPAACPPIATADAALLDAAPATGGGGCDASGGGSLSGVSLLTLLALARAARTRRAPARRRCGSRAARCAGSRSAT